MAFDWKKEYNRYRYYFLNFTRLYNQREDVRVVLGVILSLFTVSFLGVFALKPTLSTIATLWAQIRSQDEVNSKLAKKISDLSSAQNLYSSLEEKISALNQAIPGYPSPQDFAGDVEGLVARHNLKLVSSSLAEFSLLGREDEKSKKATQGSKDYFASIVASGSYDSVLSFWKDLENLRRPLVIETVTLSSAPNQESIAISISAKVPYLGI